MTHDDDRYDSLTREARASAVVVGAVSLAVLGVLALLALATGCATIERAVGAALEELDDWSPAPAATNAPGTPATPPQVADGIDLGPLASVPATVTLGALRSGSGRVSWDEQPGREAWPRKTVKVEVNAVAYLGVVRDGRTVALGKFDWTRPGQKTKGLENVAHGYGTFADANKRPRSGDRVFVVLVSVDGKQRSTPSALAEYRP